MEKQFLIDLLENNPNIGIRKLSKLTNKSFATVRYWLKKYEINTSGKFSKYNWSFENLSLALKSAKCKSDVLKFIGCSLSSSNYQILERKLKEYKIDNSNLNYDYSRGNKWKKKYDNDDIFCQNSPMSTKNIKNRIIKESMLEYKCDDCGIENEWNGKKIILQLDHINGKNNDNRLENLRFLCPNCHSQTKTFSLGQRASK